MDGMKEETGPAPPIESKAYTEEYFRTAAEGYREFAASQGRQPSPRLRHALELADPRPGQRALDIACGRGEVVLQSALGGAYAVGIDYAQAALALARQSLDGAAPAGRAALARMDAGRLAFRPQTFDVAFMLDFVEHVHQPELEEALQEVRRVLRPGGRLVVHTSPNRVFEELVYRHYVRNVHRLLLRAARALRLEGRFFNKLVLPTEPLLPHDEYERRLHVNPQSAGTLRSALQRHGFRVVSVGFWEPAQGPFFPRELRWHNLGLRLLNVVRFLRPLSLLPPLNALFSNHIWVVAERR